VARLPLFVLTSAMLSTLSCGLLSAPVAPPAPGSASASAAADTAAPDAAEVARVRGQLARRHTGLTSRELDSLAETIVVEAARQHLDPALVMAVMHVESRFNNFAVSPVGAMGLMQILPSTGEELARKQGVVWRGAATLFDPFVNVQLGTAYLRELSNRYGKLATALAAYNWGPGRIDRRLERGHRLPTDYSSLVLEAHASAQGEGRSS